MARWLGVGEFNEQPYVIGGVAVCVYIVVVQGKTMRPRATIIRVEDSEVNYLLTHHSNRMQGCDMHAERVCELTTDGGGFCNPSFHAV